MNHTTGGRYLIFDKVHFIVCSPSGDLPTKSAIFCFNIFWSQTVCTAHSLSLLSDKLVAWISYIWNVIRILSTLGFPAWAEQYLCSILGAFISFFITGQIFVWWEFARPMRVMSLGAHNGKKLPIYQQCSHTKLVYTTYVHHCYHPHYRKITSSFLTMLRFSASVGFPLLWWMKNLHLLSKTLQVPLRSPCNLHSSFTINVQLDSLRCSKTLAMIMFLNCDNGIGQVSKFTCQPSK